MRFWFLIAFVSASAALAQADLWSHVNPQPGREVLRPVSLSEARFKSFAHLIRQQEAKEIWECEASEIDDLIKGLRFESIPVALQHEVVLAEAPAGCARGGQGANGAMWLIHFDQDTPVVIASPKEFSGWLFSVQPSSSHGYSDIILGWHMSGAEASLSYFRFDGQSYHRISVATLQTDDRGNSKIVAGSTARTDVTQ